MKKYDYDHLEEIEVRRDDQKLYTFKEDPMENIVDLYKRKRLLHSDESPNSSEKMALRSMNGSVLIFTALLKDIDKQLNQRRLMRNLEKFVVGRVYGNDLRLLERTI
ncbi:hypothetical protein Tco_0830845 [Tanacetum coccineum]